MQAPQRADAGVQTHGDASQAPSGTAAALVAAAREEILRLQALNEQLLAAQATGTNPNPSPGPAPARATACAADAGEAAEGGTAHAHMVQAALRASRERSKQAEDSLRVGLPDLCAVLCCRGLLQGWHGVG